MRIIRYHYQNTISYGHYANNQIFPIRGNIFGDYQISPYPLDFQLITLLAPVEPAQCFAIGLNYQDHIGELDFAKTKPTEPISFLVSPGAIIGPNQTIILNDPTAVIDQEAELVVVIGKRCFQVGESSALDYVFGYTCGNDVSNRQLQAKDGQWLRGKSFPTYKPMGPWIETELDPSHLTIQAKINDQLVQSSNTGELLFSIPKLIAFLSSFATLNPGDVIMTGTPKGVSPLHCGDIVQVQIQGLGTLSNPVY